MLDLLVIGAGLAGLSAALTAAEAGLSVRVIAKGMGALHWSAGTVDVLGYLPQTDAPAERPLAQMSELEPAHPYALCGAENVRAALAWFQSIVAEQGLPYVAAEDEANTWLPSPAGAKRPAYLVPAAQTAGTLDRRDPMLIVGLQGMRDFYPTLIAENLGKQGISARAAFVPLDKFTSRRDANTIHLAQAFDQPQRRRRFGEALARLVRPGERIGLPAILGLDDHAAVLSDLQAVAGAPIFEIPTLPPSVPGTRLYRALRSRLRHYSVRIEAGMEVIGFSGGGKRIRWVETETSARPLRHHAGAYLLATGGILGGGFSSDAAGRFWEVVFDLPLSAPPDRSQWFRGDFLDPRGQPIFQAGVEVDDGYRPVDADGQPVYDNLWAAGGLLAHADPLRERSLEGLSIAAGRGAALALIRSAARQPAQT